MGYMDKLRNYITKAGLDQRGFAKTAKLSDATISRMLAGIITDPAVSVALAIERATNGKIRCEDWVNGK